jgi:hypothetical protein
MPSSPPPPIAAFLRIGRQYQQEEVATVVVAASTVARVATDAEFSVVAAAHIGISSGGISVPG